MKRPLLLLALVAGCSKPPAPGPLAGPVKSFKSTLSEYLSLVARHKKLEGVTPAPKELEEVEEKASAKRDQLKTFLESLGPSADLGLKAKPDDPDGLEARWIASYFTCDSENANPALDRLSP